MAFANNFSDPLSDQQRAEIARTVAAWPPLSPAQRDDVAALLTADGVR